MQDINNDQGENERDSKSLEIQIQSDSEEFMAVFESKLKIRILMTLLIYPELTLSQLRDKIGKVKSTISKHMEELLAIGLVNRRERKYRSDKKQHIFSKVKKLGFRGQCYEDIKLLQPKEFHSVLKSEYTINKRLFSYILEVNEQVIEYIKDFYKLEPEHLTDEFKENVYRYDTCVPRFRFMTKEEYIEYREKFLEFDETFIKEMERKRLKEQKNTPKEYLAINELIPIKIVMEHILEKRKKEKKEQSEINDS
ncbi:MAG: hypothetical protein ACTSRE_14225 [Promethearchaeota archaeon]